MKTNQFNLTTRRYHEEKIRELTNNKNYEVGCAHVEDKFGDNGITGVYIVNKENKQEWLIDTFLLSCRIIGRGVEEALLGQILKGQKRKELKMLKLSMFKQRKINLRKIFSLILDSQKMAMSGFLKRKNL